MSWMSRIMAVVFAAWLVSGATLAHLLYGATSVGVTLSYALIAAIWLAIGASAVVTVVLLVAHVGEPCESGCWCRD